MVIPHLVALFRKVGTFGGGALLEEVHHWGGGIFEVYSLIALSVLFPFSIFYVWMKIASANAFPAMMGCILSGAVIPDKTFTLLVDFSCGILSQSQKSN